MVHRHLEPHPRRRTQVVSGGQPRGDPGAEQLVTPATVVPRRRRQLVLDLGSTAFRVDQAGERLAVVLATRVPVTDSVVDNLSPSAAGVASPASAPLDACHQASASG